MAVANHLTFTLGNGRDQRWMQ